MGGMKDTLGDQPYSDLFGGMPPHQKHSTTSKQSAAAIKNKVGPLHQKIIDWMKLNPAGATDEAMGEILKIGPNTFRPRRRELELMGRIKDSGQTAPTHSGRSAVIWVLK